jgi:hypothetical protein
MAVVINEFEVVTEPAAPQTRSTPETPAQPAAQPPDVERVAAALRARAQRVRAY